jgi:ribonuclease HI
MVDGATPNPVRVICSRCLKQVALHTDGSCLGNPGAGGWAAILVYKGIKKEFSGSDKQTKSGRMELRAVIEGLRRLEERCSVSIECDSKYIVNAFNDDWIEKWQRRGWRTANGEAVLNQDLWRELVAEVAKHDVRWTWVQGHAGDPYNERCHALAVQACERAVEPPRAGSWLNPIAKKPRRSRDIRPKAKPAWNPWNDAEMRMNSEVAGRPTCPECGFSNGDHARMCSRR